LLSRLIPEVWKERFRIRVRQIAWEGRREAAPLYVPFQGDAHTFFVPKATESGARAQELPIPPREMWLGYGATAEEYLKSGEVHVAQMNELSREHGNCLGQAGRVLELGCAAGRMIRYVPDVAARAEIWGTDICAEHVYWCQEHFPSRFHFATTTIVPHLPFEDRFFDFIYCGSVFTHIEDLADAWLLELRRVLSPTGQLYFTVHDDDTVSRLDGPDSGHWLAGYMKSQPLYQEAKGQWGMLVIGRGPSSVVFYDTEFLLRKVSAVFQVLGRRPHAYGYQTAILAKRPD